MWDWELLKSGSSNHHYEIVSKYGNEDFQYSHAISYGSSEDEYCLHSHAMYELVCSISGDVVYLIEGHQYHMENGSLLLISPAVPHKLFICSDDPFERHSFYINFAGSNSTLSTMINQFRCVSGHDRFGSIYYEPQDVESILKDFERLSKVSSSPKESSRNLVPYLAEGLLANLIFVLDGISPLQFTKSTTKTIDQIMLYLNKNFTKSLTLQSVADSFHISKDYCNRLFKQAIVGNGGEYNMAATEGFGNQLTHVGLGYVIHGYIPYAAFGKLARQDVGCVLCTAIYGAVNHHDRALILRRIGAPFVILLYDPWEIIPPNRTMQGGRWC